VARRVEPAWTLLTFESLRALRQEPSAVQTTIRIANDLSANEIAGSAVTRNTLILLRQATERGPLPVTTTGNLSRAVVAEMRGLIEWPHYDQADAFRLNKVINEPDFLPLACRPHPRAGSYSAASRPQTAQGCGGGTCQQDGPHRLGVAGQGRHLSRACACGSGVRSLAKGG
jgi:hypothetical protein